MHNFDYYRILRKFYHTNPILEMWHHQVAGSIFQVSLESMVKDLVVIINMILQRDRDTDTVRTSDDCYDIYFNLAD